MKATTLKQALLDGRFNDHFAVLYGAENIPAQIKRYADATDAFIAQYGDMENAGYYSVSGRTELSGNHTDHNHGCVIAASLNLDIIAVAAPTDTTVVRIQSAGYAEDVVDYAEWTSPREARFGKSNALIAGVVDGFKKNGYTVGGLCAYTTSNVLKGSGMSSSAAFEDMVGNLLNHLYNDGKIDNVEIAKIAQYSENVFFGKPCGLMDQMACGVGGIIAIDFADTTAPVIEKLDFDMSGAGYMLCITDTGGNHADLTDDYAAVPREMKAVASHFGAPYLRLVDEQKVLDSVGELRQECGDRAVMRALHFYEENKRVALQKQALQSGDVDAYFDLTKASGRSSFCYLQNVYTTKNVAEQGLSLALCLTEKYMQNKSGAFRVHGGGFAGTIQAFVKAEDAEGYRALIDGAFGEGKCMVLRIRPEGAVKI